MRDLIDWLLDLEGTVEVLDVSMSFAWPIPSWILVFVLIGLGMTAWYCYRREAEDRPLWERGSMITLRTLTWGILIILALQPQLDIERLIEPRSNIAILVDESASMSLNDRSDPEYLAKAAEALGKDDAWVRKATRMQVVSDIFKNRDFDLVDRLGQQHAVHGYRFGEETAEWSLGLAAGESLKVPRPEAPITQLGTALREAPERLRGLPLAGIVVFTDGASNKGEEPLLAAQALAERKVPVFPVGIGAPHAVDVVVLDVDMPDLLFADDATAVRVQLRATGLNNVEVPLEVRLGSELVGETRVRLRDGEQQADIAITPGRTGDLSCVVSVPAQAEELVTDNNSKQRRVRVIDDAIRVLLASDTPSWELRYLMGTLLHDKRVDTKVYMRRGDTRRSETDPLFLTEFPQPEELRATYDCVVLCNLDANQLDPMHLESMHQFVTEEGGGLIMVSATRGTPATFVNTSLESLLPVVVEAINESPRLDLADTFKRGFSLKLARDGALHISTRLEPLPEDNARLWSELPEQYWYYTGIRRAKPTASVLVEHGEARNAYGPIPLLATHAVGRGQVMFLGFNSWRWRFRLGNRLFDRFWGQTIQYMGLPHLLGSMNRVNFLTEARDFTVGESIPIRVRVLDAEFQPVRLGTIELVARSGAREVRFELAAHNDRPGLFSGHIVLDEGSWTIQVTGREDDDSLVIDSLPARWEFQETAMQRKNLEQLATTTGGQYIELGDIDKLPDIISATTRRAHSQLEIELWDTWLGLLLLALCLGSEWYLRRRIDLP
jgi:hypothetical protein